jgi:hypothetical protein
MLDYLSGTPRRLDVDFVPSPSGGGMYLWQQEEVHSCHLVLSGSAPDLDGVETHALITGVGCVQTVFGYPNEEAFWKDPRGELGGGCFEIEGSHWEANIEGYNRRSFGAAYFSTGELHHYFVGSKDSSCQILARALQVELFPEMTIRQVVEESWRRVRLEQADLMKAVQERIEDQDYRRHPPTR